MTTRAVAAIAAASGDAVLALENVMRERDEALLALRSAHTLMGLALAGDLTTRDHVNEVWRKADDVLRKQPCPTCGEPPPSQETHTCRSGGAR